MSFPECGLKVDVLVIVEFLAFRSSEAWPEKCHGLCPWVSTGAAVLIVASEHRAKKITNKPVWIADTVTVHQEKFRAGVFDAEESRGEVYSQDVAAAKLYKRNGITNPLKEIDVAEIYEPSTWEEMTLYEHFGWCEKDRGWTMIENGMTQIEGAFPVNPSGGVLSANAIGATPAIRLAEAALQVRGDAGQHQVPKKVNTALATALGGSNWTVMTLLKKNL